MASPRISDSLQTIFWATGALVLFFVLNGFFPDLGQQLLAAHVEAGHVTDVSITLVTADAEGLSCAMDSAVAGARCAYDRKGKPVEGGGPTLAPYMTVDSQSLFLIPDLWSEPALKERLAADPPRDANHSKRFQANCKFTAKEEAKDFLVRWSQTGDWGYREKAWVGTVSGCTIRG